MVYNHRNTFGGSKMGLYCAGSSRFMVEMGCWINTFLLEISRRVSGRHDEEKKTWTKKLLPAYKHKAKKTKDKHQIAPPS